MKTLKRVLVWLLVLGQMSWAIPAEAAPPQPKASPAPERAMAAAPQGSTPRVVPNRRLPSVQPVPLAPAFSAWPSDEEIFRARIFAEPLVPIGSTTPDENTTLARALTAYLGAGGGERTEDLVAFLEGRKTSPWRASLQLNLGLVHRRTGYFLRALRAWEEAWGIAKSATTPHGRAVADRAVGELAQLHARLGNQERLEQLFGEIDGRDIGGAAGELIAGAKRGLWLMQNQPERSFRCGPLAIDRILASTNAGYRGDGRLHTYPSTSKGTALLEMRNLANELGLGFQASLREDPGAAVLVPALVHWKAGHFAALVKEQGGRYLIQDPTFGEEIWVSRRAFDEETSGYMLVREGALPDGWRSVPDTEAESVRGKGATNESLVQDQKCGDHQSGGNPTCCPMGLATYSFHTMLVNLHISDTPLGYSPPRGPAVSFSLTYNQREAFQPQVFSYGNVGPKWNHGWQSYIEDDPVTPSQPVNLYLRGGGQETFTGYNATTQAYARHEEDRSQVVRVSTSPVRYERRLIDGSVEEYGQPDGASTFPRRVFLTHSIDPQGNALTFTYDASLRLVGVTDAIGQVTTLSYELPGDPLKLTKVTDPFGRFATLEYENGRLTRITDVIGMQSSFGYGAADFIQSMTTPYGTTTFSAFDEGRRRWLEAKDPLGGRERLEYVNSAGDALIGAESAAAIPYALPNDQYPTGFDPAPPYGAANLWYRNTFFWSKLAMARAPGDYSKAKLIHWLHTPGLTQTAGVIENEKEPMESMRTFYQYPDMGWQITGSYAKPSAVGRVIEDGSSQIYRYEYNARGRTTKAIDPLGRETVYEYDTNDIDLLRIKQKNPGSLGGYDLLASYTYNAQHRKLTSTDAAGQTTTYTYNAQGQGLTVTTPPRAGITEERTTTYSYDTNGYLQSVTGPVTGAIRTQTYDGYGRIRTVTDSDNYTVTYDYDALDRPTRTTFPDSTYEETVLGDGRRHSTTRCGVPWPYGMRRVRRRSTSTGARGARPAGRAATG